MAGAPDAGIVRNAGGGCLAVDWTRSIDRSACRLILSVLKKGRAAVSKPCHHIVVSQPQRRFRDTVRAAKRQPFPGANVRRPLASQTPVFGPEARSVALFGCPDGVREAQARLRAVLWPPATAFSARASTQSSLPQDASNTASTIEKRLKND